MLALGAAFSRRRKLLLLGRVRQRGHCTGPAARGLADARQGCWPGHVKESCPWALLPGPHDVGLRGVCRRPALPARGAWGKR